MIIYIVPYINEVSKPGMERRFTGAHRTPRFKLELVPQLEETESIFKEAPLEVLLNIFQDDTYTVDILMSHFRNPDGSNKRNFQIKWEIYDSFIKNNNFLNRMEFMPEMQMFPEILKSLTSVYTPSARNNRGSNSPYKVACITHGFTMVSERDPVGFLHWMRARPDNGDLGLYSDAIARSDFINNIFNGGHYQFPNGSSIEFQYNMTTKKCSNLKAKHL